MKKSSMEFLRLNARRDLQVCDADMATTCEDIIKSHEAMLNMLQHIHWHDGVCQPRSMDALTRMVGLKPTKQNRGATV